MENKYPKHISDLVNWLEEKKAEDIKVLNVTGETDFTDYIILCNASSGLHMKAIADNVIRNSKKNNIHIHSKEGLNNDRWILLDFIDTILHIFSYEARNYYKIEDIFSKSKELKREKQTIQSEL